MTISSSMLFPTNSTSASLRAHPYLFHSVKQTCPVQDPFPRSTSWKTSQVLHVSCFRDHSLKLLAVQCLQTMATYILSIVYSLLVED